MMPTVETMKKRVYAERNIANGKCSTCPEPRDQTPTRFCLKHLNKNLDYQRRFRARRRAAR